ncbi:OprO/OprP family phosphate-selective porin [Psychroflexus montanilacus]|uniref:OprO/OprP family phosphate-selective porin n=1 Tax=Psychroflexus montanilacus TaxID=2873598 RepID=UPI001CCC7211|nr:OprO/OprP family phosphate-selective porin [Psychroflexus montanilacus]MBZ9651707.1 OprO/OprP family phosphate-selective porin [Psychroflexus montanilacus]
MKSLKLTVLMGLMLAFSLTAFAQKRDLDNFRPRDQRGMNVFEAPKDTVTTFDGVKVRIGGAYTLQFQALDHENNGAVPLKALGSNFNLATANLDIDVALYDGVRMHLRTYLSSRHHPEPYVKGGYLLVDKLDFVSEGFMAETMKYVTLKFGHMEINYGDAHFRRSDNAQTIYNPFIGNYLMDAFTTEVGLEAYYRRDGWIAMLGVTNGKLNQSVEETNTKPSFLAKFGYDKQYNDDFRFRLTGSMYTTQESSKTWLYDGDRAGSRYYFVMEDVDATSAGNFRSGRINPGLSTELTSIMVNPFVRYKGLEFFGLYENASGKGFGPNPPSRTYSHYAADLIYRFGETEDFYVGGRYSFVDGEEASGQDISVDRLQLGAGWFMTKNILAKLEYVKQSYSDFDAASILADGQFDGLMLEAVISF